MIRRSVPAKERKNFNKTLAAVLAREGVVVLLTDTIYGIVGSALSKKVVERIYRIKGREETKPFIVLIAKESDLLSFGVRLSLAQKRYLRSAWSLKAKRPTSVILPVPQKKFEYLHRGNRSIAFRLPRSAALRDLLSLTGPLVAPSANPAGQEPAETLRQAEEYFKADVDLYVDGGSKKGKPSLLIRMDEHGEIEILRK